MKRFLTVIGFALLVSACGNDNSVKVEEGDIERVQRFNVGMPVGAIEDQKHGKETWLGVGALAGVGTAKANGVAYGHGFEDGAYMLTGQLNIEIAADGMFYQAWLKNEETGEIIEAGRPQPSFGDVRHGLRLESKNDLSAYRTVLVSLEEDDGNTAMGLLVAQGTLKEQKRLNK